MDEILECKSMGPLFDRVANENGQTQLFFYDSYMIKQLKYGESVHTATVYYSDITSYKEEKRFLSIFDKRGGVLAVLHGEVSLLPQICERLGRSLPTLDEWILLKYGESGERYVCKNAARRVDMGVDFTFYANYLKYEEFGSVFIVPYGRIFAMMDAYVSKNRVRYNRIALLAREEDGTVRYMRSAYCPLDAKAYLRYLKKKILRARPYLLFTDNGVGRVYTKGLFFSYPKKKPQNKPCIFSYNGRELYEIYLYQDSASLVCYRALREGTLTEESYTLAYSDIRQVSYQRREDIEPADATVTIESERVPDGRLVLRAEQSYSASEAFAQLFSMLEERTRASIEERNV